MYQFFFFLGMLYTVPPLATSVVFSLTEIVLFFYERP
jgi:hypothetical protein